MSICRSMLHIFPEDPFTNGSITSPCACKRVPTPPCVSGGEEFLHGACSHNRITCPLNGGGKIRIATCTSMDEFADGRWGNKKSKTKRLREAEHTRRHTVAGEGARPLYTSGLMMQNSWEGEVRSYATDMYVVRKRGKVGERNQKITQVRMSLGYPTRAPVEAGPPSGWPVTGYNVS